MFSEASKFFSILFLLFFIVIGCKTYHGAIPLSEAVNTSQEGLFKVTSINGDEFIYEKIVSENDTVYGIITKNGLEQKTELKHTEVKKVEVHNRKSSTGSNILGVGVGVGVVVLGVLMFSS